MSHYVPQNFIRVLLGAICVRVKVCSVIEATMRIEFDDGLGSKINMRSCAAKDKI